MNTKAKLLLAVLFGSMLLLNVSCDSVGGGDDDFGALDLAPMDTSGSLKAAADFPVGIGISREEMLNNSTYASIVRNQFDNVTFEYAMKQAPIVQSDGSFDYNAPDALLNHVQDLGLGVFGHTLVWHSNNNGDYLRSLVSGSGGGDSGLGPNLLDNGSFEAGTGDELVDWAVYNNEDATFSATTEEVYDGDRALKIENNAPHDGEPWRVQIGSPEVETEIGTQYQVSFWIKAAQDGGSGRLSTQPTAQYQPDFQTSTEWIPISWTFTAEDPQTTVLFDMGLVANSYYIDDVEVIPAEEGGGGGGSSMQDSVAVENFMKEYITSTVNHYEDMDIVGWDVVNEPLQDGTGDVRTDLTPETPTEGDTFYWAKYLGTFDLSDVEAIGNSYIARAFRYAEEADPDVPLYINEYNLESDAAKRDAMVQLVNGLVESDVPIDGIGTQMHISLDTEYADIDQMFRDLASTGLKIRVSELDVRINPDDVANFEPTPTLLAYQQVMYHYVVWSYMQNVPEDQRAGISVWNLTDRGSWIVENQGADDYPTLYNDDYEPKPAYSGFLRGLKGLEPSAE